MTFLPVNLVMSNPLHWVRSLTVAGVLCFFLSNAGSALPTNLHKQLLEPVSLSTSEAFLSRFKECEQLIERSSNDIRGLFRNCSVATTFPMASKYDTRSFSSCANATRLRTKCVFMSHGHLKQFIKLLDLKYAILGRPRFGKRSRGADNRLLTPSLGVSVGRSRISAIRQQRTQNPQPKKVSKSLETLPPSMANGERQQHLLLTTNWKIDVQQHSDSDGESQQNLAPQVDGDLVMKDVSTFHSTFQNISPRLKHIAVFSDDDFDRNHLQSTIGDELFQPSDVMPMFLLPRSDSGISTDTILRLQ